MTRSPIGVAGVLLLVALAGCTSPGPRAKTATPSTASTTSGPRTPEHYGAAPQAHPDVTLQPDVVVVGGGSGAIRAASDDALTWVLDAHAPNADQLQVGKVMYATSTAVGRVAAVHREADTVTVTLLPVQLGEVIRDGHLHVSRDLDLTQMAFVSVPDLPGAVSDIKPAAPSPAHSWRGGPAGHTALPPPFTQGTVPWSAGDWTGEISRTSGDVHIKAQHDTEGGLRVFGDLDFSFARPHLDADLGIVDGEVGDSELQLRGLRRVSLDLRAAAVNGLPDNVHQKIEIPVSVNVPVVIGGVAMNLSLRFKLLAQAAFSARNSTISVTGEWTTDGPLSYDRTKGAVKVQVPKVSQDKDPIDSLRGISIGVTGFVIAAELRVLLGLGNAEASAGPYLRLVPSLAVTIGSGIGLVRCRQSTASLTFGAGVGISISDDVAKRINEVLKRAGVQFKVEEDAGKDLLTRTLDIHKSWDPDKAICRLS